MLPPPQEMWTKKGMAAVDPRTELRRVRRMVRRRTAAGYDPPSTAYDISGQVEQIWHVSERQHPDDLDELPRLY